MTAAAAAFWSRRHSISDAGTSARNLDCAWYSGRPHQVRAEQRLAQRPGVRSPGNRRVPALSPGDKVTHDTYGLGTVVSLQGSADDPEAKKAELIAAYRKIIDVYIAAGNDMIDDVIDPRETRATICRALEMAAGKQIERPWKRQGVVPV